MAQCAKPHLVLNAGLGARSRRPGVPHPWPIQQVSFRGLQERTGTAWDTNDLKFLPRSTDNLSVRKSQSKNIRRGRHRHTQREGKRKAALLPRPCRSRGGMGSMVLFLHSSSHCYDPHPHLLHTHPKQEPRPRPCQEQLEEPPPRAVSAISL